MSHAGHGTEPPTDAAILAATLEEITEVGVAEASVPAIAERSGADAPSIYRRWGTREYLLLDALLRQTRMDLPTPDTGTVRGDLVAMLRDAAAWLATPAGDAVLRTMMLDAPGRFADARATFWASRRAALQPIIERGIARGELPSDVDAAALFTALISPLHIHALARGGDVPASLPERLVDLVLTGAASNPRDQVAEG